MDYKTIYDDISNLHAAVRSLNEEIETFCTNLYFFLDALDIVNKRQKNDE